MKQTKEKEKKTEGQGLTAYRNKITHLDVKETHQQTNINRETNKHITPYDKPNGPKSVVVGISVVGGGNTSGPH